MESYLLHWPEDEQWRISAARVEGQGKAVVLQIESTHQPTERVEMVSILGGLDRSVAEIVEGQVEQARQSSPDLSYHILQQSKEGDDHAWLSFSIEGIEEEGEAYSSIGHVIIGEQGTYLLILKKEGVKLSAEAKAKWATFFQSGRLVSQSLRQTLAESQLIGGELPQLHANTEEDATTMESPSQKELVLSQHPNIQTVAHPDHPDDVPVWFYVSDHQPHPLVQIWVKLIGEHQGLLQGLVIKTAPQFEVPVEQEVIYLQWSEARQSFYQVIPRLLLELEDWELSPCQPCGFEGLMHPLADVVAEGLLKVELQCVCCGGRQVLTHKNYVPNDVLPPEETKPQQLTWWQRFFMLVLSFSS